MSRVYGALVRRPLQRYNVDHRAEKVIRKIEDPTAAPMRAPMYASDAELLEEIRRTKPEVADSQVRKDSELHNRLRDVFITSEDPDMAPQPPRVDRPLPRDTRQYSYDFVPAQRRLEREGVSRALPRGKVSLEQAVEFIARHKETEGGQDHVVVADKYRVNPETARNTLKYFHVFSLMETNTRESEMTMPDPLIAGKDWVEMAKPGFTKTREEDERVEERIEAARERALTKRGLVEGGNDRPS